MYNTYQFRFILILQSTLVMSEVLSKPISFIIVINKIEQIIPVYCPFRYSYNIYYN